METLEFLWRGREQAARGLFDPSTYDRVNAYFDGRSDRRPTPLVWLPALAAGLGIDAVLVKDESTRFGLDAFKVLGAEYAIERLLEEAPDGVPTILVCASAGNHGRAVARVAAERGLRARVYVARGTAGHRIAAIEGEGAEVVEVDGTYDDSVRRAARDGEAGFGLVVSDTGWPGYEVTPRRIMAGYTRMMHEAAGQWGRRAPDLVFVQVGVGALAAGVTSWVLDRGPRPRPRVVAVEPATAACFLASLRAGTPTVLPREMKTEMAGLRCAELSTAAWPVLRNGVDAVIAMPDAQAFAAVDRLARPRGTDPAIVSAASGAAGLGALLALADDRRLVGLRQALGFGARTRALVINTEGDTDPEGTAHGVAGLSADPA